MGELIAMLAKYGVEALPTLFHQYGVVTTLLGFVVFAQVGRLTLGLALIILGAFFPNPPQEGNVHKLHFGIGKFTIVLEGSVRTVLMGIGALVVLSSLFPFGNG